MPMATVARKWTVDEVWALPEDGKRYEVIDGELVDPDARVLERWTPDDDRPEI